MKRVVLLLVAMFSVPALGAATVTKSPKFASVSVGTRPDGGAWINADYCYYSNGKSGGVLEIAFLKDGADVLRKTWQMASLGNGQKLFTFANSPQSLTWSGDVFTLYAPINVIGDGWTFEASAHGSAAIAVSPCPFGGTDWLGFFGSGFANVTNVISALVDVQGG